LAEIEPTPPAPKGAGYVRLDHSATVGDRSKMISVAILFKASSPTSDMNMAVKECNHVLLEDFRPRHELDFEDPPDLLIVGRDTTFAGKNTVVGLLTLHHTEASRACELGSMSARKTHSHGTLFSMFMDRVPGILLDTMHEDTKASWIVKRVAQSNKSHINALKSIGFVEPPHFLIRVLSDEGYIPFDPFDEVLMKRRLRLCPPLLVKAEEEEEAINRQHMTNGPNDDCFL
jgi:hypothetical protein